ncbi:Uncharacterised protein [Candidatus Norongarragalina meridionalis]|nr:Uncharacterised protein [Candidatus Norongarragalina meridionalis]
MGTQTTVAGPTHTHTVNPTVQTIINVPEYRNLTLIRSKDVNGIPATLPQGAIAFFNTTVPTNWAQYTYTNFLFVRAAVTANGTNASTAATHWHDVSYTLTAPSGVASPSGTTANAASAKTHAHTNGTAQTLNTSNNEPPYETLILGYLTVDGDALPTGLIGIFNATPGTNWTTISASGGAMYEKFIMGSATYGTTGGNTYHTHADNMTGMSSSWSTVNTTGRATTSGGVAQPSHRHTSVALNTPNTVSNYPLFADVILGYYFKPPANLKIAQFRIYQDNKMTLGTGTLKCNLTSAYGYNISNSECDNVTNGNLAVNTMHRAEFRLCNDQNGGSAATFTFFGHNLTTNKAYQIGTFYNDTGCYYTKNDGSGTTKTSYCKYEPNTGVVSIGGTGISIAAGSARADTDTSCTWLMYNFTTGNPSNQVQANSSANVTGVNLGTNPDVDNLGVTIKDYAASVIDVTVNCTAIGFGSLAPGTTNSSSSGADACFPLVVTIHEDTNLKTFISVNGSDLISGGNTITVRNVTYTNSSITNYKTELNATFTSGSDNVGQPFDDWIQIAIPAGGDTTRDIYWWLTAPSLQRKSTYAGTIYVKVSSTPG